MKADIAALREVGRTLTTESDALEGRRPTPAFAGAGGASPNYATAKAASSITPHVFRAHVVLAQRLAMVADHAVASATALSDAEGTFAASIRQLGAS